MLKTYLKIAVRNFMRERFYSFINLGGLAIGIAVVLAISLYILQELSYDRFHSKADRIYRVAMHVEMGGNAADFNATFPPLAKAIESEVPDVESAVRIEQYDGKVFRNDDRVFAESDVLFTDRGFFDVFDFTVLAGDPSSALNERGNVLLTPALVTRYFGADRDLSAVLGETIQVGGEPFVVTGVVAEAPANSHFRFGAIGSIESTGEGRDEAWNNMNVSTYLLVKEGADIRNIEARLPDVFRKYMKDFDRLPEAGIIMSPIIQPLTDIHLHSNIQGEFEPPSNPTILFVLGSVAGVVLLLACVNFVNLVTARAANRSKEVGVRKVLGSASRQLARQFTTESVAFVFLATLLGLGIIELARVPFRELSGKELPVEMLLDPTYAVALLLFILVLGMAAGSYPAFFLASFSPAQALKGKLRAGFRSSNLRNVLVTFQFIISIVLIASTLVVHRQLSFMRNKDLGFDRENVLIVDNADKIPSSEALVNALRSLPAIQQVGSAQFMPVDDYDGRPLLSEDDRNNSKLVNFSIVDFDYLPALKFEFVEGRNFSPDIPSDSNAVILNERAANYLFTGNALGRSVYQDEGSAHEVIGIVRDFNFESLKNEVRPLVFFPGQRQRYLHIRLNPGDYSESISAIEKLWKQYSADIPFTYTFLDDEYTALFKEEVRLGNLFSVFTGLALVIACLGLLGLAAYMAEQRKKEISVRKVLGATVSNLVLMMSRDFARLVLFALVISVPVAYVIMGFWLDHFVYKVEVTWATLIGGGLIVLLIAFVTVSLQALRAASVNPVESLKEE